MYPDPKSVRIVLETVKEKKNMRICSIASGSSGNCIYVGDEHTHVLVDTGISKKRIEE